MRVAPAWAENDAPDAIYLSSAYGLIPDDWQCEVLEGWMGRQPSGKWAASTCGLAVPRQNGKNGVIEVRELFGMVSLGEKFLHTAHEVKTARKAFVRLASFFENPRQYPELFKLVKEIRRTNGQEAIVLRNGGSCEFIARSKGSGRGFTVDVLVMDEAQQLSDDALSALQPTISAAPLANPQTIYTGTPPGPSMNSEVWERVRAAGKERSNKRLCWIDYGLEGPLPDVNDRGLWAQTNPALGVRLHLDTIIDERASMNDEMFARERLGWWGDSFVGGAIPAEAWAACMDRSSRFDSGPTGLGVYLTGDRTTAYVAAVGQCDGLLHTELLPHNGSLDWRPSHVVAEIAAMNGRRPAPVAIDPGSHAGSLIQPLEDAGVEVVQVTLQKLAQSCGQFYDAVTTQQIRHIGQPDLNSAVASASTREVARAAWLWKGQVSPLMAATLALHAYSLASDTESWGFFE